jgi:hypothetical protein
MGDYNFGSTTKTTSIELGPVPLTALNQMSVLNKDGIGGEYGRVPGCAACFKID